MNSASRYSAVNTKIRAMERRFLKDQDFINLLQKKDVSEIASYLKYETHYKDALKGIDENSIRRRQLEVLIKKDHALQIGKIAHYFYDSYRRFFMYVFIKREIGELKTILRGISEGKNEESDRNLFPNIVLLSRINVEALLSSANINEFVKNLKGSVYYRYLQPLEGTKDGRAVFMGEMALDLAYFDIFYRYSEGLTKEDRKIVEKLQGINADLLNIQWIYRGINYYDLQREILFNYTIHHGSEFKMKDIKDLCYVKDINEFQEIISNTKYKFLFENENTKDIFMERRILRYQFFNIKKIKNKNMMNITSALAFDLMLEYEIRDLITVIESVRYGLPVDEAKKFLIRKL